eukprot:6565258-Prorocentrum_lima.AAC.1
MFGESPPPPPGPPPSSSATRSSSSETTDYNQQWQGWQSESSGSTTHREGTGVPGAVPNPDWSE